MRRIALILLLAITMSTVVGCGFENSERIVIGGKNFTEQELLVYLLEGVIEGKTDVEVETKPYLGGTNVVDKALERGDLDVYVEYTGTALLSILGMEAMNDPDAVYEKVKKVYEEDRNLIWLEPLGFNNTYTLAMKKDKVEELGIQTFSDLKKHAPNLVLAGTQEFLERVDGYKGLKKAYDMNFKDVKGMDPGLTYRAVKDDKVDVNTAFATDGRIAAFKLVTLKDNKNYFPPYYAAPIIRKDTLEKYPQLEDAINSLAGKLNDEVMRQLNAQVDIEKKDAKKVALEWLKSEGIIE
ncbi:glycine betaine ABC transporter substrate-binding protein [Caldisalinibacter kiritimatiensis]|uniref:L-proline glycine betaine binding ABC transporter protein ProX / Osmotic adaptation n=1 Tax=Caldisalinibacter kiritimatiensis TaxID=1304284 RepID=R1AS76_9FIRM|nr:glycine betaine ABC transporter substrate-binding protein [Caldisalinibacter kiritimatiensis]EOC99486.1 L-proline glycine betaine binding ABC transporter protein ProX / Osmotic adaptation [Caldisalinibacter kiritimatiensis]